MRNRSRSALAALLALTAAGLAACGGGTAPRSGTAAITPASTAAVATSASTAATAPAPAPSAARASIFLPDRTGQVLVQTPVPVAGGPRDPAGALRALIAARGSPIPHGTRLLGVTVRGTTATVDLSGALATGYPPGGTLAESILLGSIVYTVTQAGPESVRLLVDGRTPHVPSQYDLSAPLRRTDLPSDIAAAL